MKDSRRYTIYASICLAFEVFQLCHCLPIRTQCQGSLKDPGCLTYMTSNSMLHSTQINMFERCIDYDPTTAPLSQYLLCESLDLIEEAYHSNFVYSIKRGILHPIEYAKYDLQDWIFLEKSAEIFRRLCSLPTKSCDQKISNLLEEIAAYYSGFADQKGMLYSVQSDSSIVSIHPATQGYIDYERLRVEANEAKYAAVVMTPCLQLWPTIADRMIAEGAAETECKLYSFWIEDNKEYIPQSLLTYLDTETFDRYLALDIYQEGIQHEINMFSIVRRPPTKSVL